MPPTARRAADAERPGPPTGEQPIAGGAPPTGEEPIPDAGPPTGEAADRRRRPPTAEQALPEPIPPETEAPHALAAEAPQADPGPGTAETPQLDPNQPRREQAPPPRAGRGDRGGGLGAAAAARRLVRRGRGLPRRRRPEHGRRRAHGRRHGEGGSRRGGFLGALLRHPFRILAAVVLILILLFLNALFQPFHGDGHGKVVVDIPKGSSVGEVGDLLEKKGVISDGFVVSGSTLFQARVTIAGKRSDLFAGKFTMKKA